MTAQEKRRKYCIDNAERIKETHRIYNQKHKERLKPIKHANYLKHRERILKEQKEKRIQQILKEMGDG